MSNLEVLIGDPLFQLNLILWQAQPLPAGISMRALFNEAGYSVHSISLNLALPLRLRSEVQRKGIAAQDSATPDVILKKEPEEFYLLAEAKSSSFSASSSSARQARTFLLLGSENLAEALGLAIGVKATGITTYVTKRDRCELLRSTLEFLSRELEGNGLKSNQYCCVGLKAEPGVIDIVVSASDAKMLGLPASGEVKVYEGDPDTDLRPLYFIPFDPDVEQSQEEAAYARQALEQRVQVELITAIGKASPPERVSVSAEELLEKATWGMYGLWKNTAAKRYLHRRIYGFLNKLLAGKVGVSDGRRCIDVSSVEERDGVLGMLMKAKPEAWAGAGEQLSFDNMTNNV